MEAFGAAGAGVGLLGSAVSGLKELRNFIGAIHDGPYDLEMARRRLDQHAAFLPKLQTEYDTRYNACVSVEERADFVRCLQDCQEDVNRYKEVLEKASKTRTRGKGLQKLEAGARMYFSEDDFKKQKSTLLDRTVQLQTFIDRAHRLCTDQSFRAIESSITQHRAEEMNMHSSTQSSLQDRFNLLATKEDITSGIDSIADKWTAAANLIETSQKQAMSMHSSVDASITTIVRTIKEHHLETQMVQHSHQSTLQGMQETIESQFLPIARFLTAELCRSGRGNTPLNRRSSGQRIQERADGFDGSAETGQISSYLRQTEVARTHKTPFGRLYVLVSTDSDRQSREKTRTSYFVRFFPFKIFSQTVIDWKCVINTSRSGPLMSMWCNVGRVCDDLDVIDALGLVTADSCDVCARRRRDPDERICRHTKTPNASKLMRLLDQRRFTPTDVIEVRKGFTTGILKLFIQFHKPCRIRPDPRLIPVDTYKCSAMLDMTQRSCGFKNRHACAREPPMENPFEWEDLRTSYLEYYNALAMLVRDAGCQLDRKDWFGLITEVGAYRCHMMDSHTEFAKTDQFISDSVPKLLLSVVGDHIPLDHNHIKSWKHRPFTSHIFSLVGAPFRLDCRSYLGHLLPYEACFHEIMEVISSIGGFEKLASSLWFDRSSLVMMSYSRPWLGHLISLLTQGNRKLVPAFSLEAVLREMRERHGSLELRALIEYLTTYGHLNTVRRLVLEGFDAATMITSAVERTDDQILDCLLDKDTKWSSVAALKQAVHVNRISDRICKDSAFRSKLIDILAFRFSDKRCGELALTDSEYSPLAELLANRTARNASQGGTDEIPLYVTLLIDGYISQYESRNFSFPGDLWSFVYTLSHHVIFPKVPETHQEFRRKDRIFQRFLSMECFRSCIEYVPKAGPPFCSKLSPGTMGFTPLMMALDSGMVSIVKLLLDAGAQITSRTPYGISAFQLAEQNTQDDHPRVIYRYGWGKYKEFAVSEDIDEVMFKLLRETLRNRGEEVPVPRIPNRDIERPLRPLHRAYRKVQEWIKILLSWLLKPAADINQESLSKRFEYIAVVWFVGLLSVTKLLQPNAQWFVAVGLRQFSRPVLLVPIVAWVMMMIWQYYVTE